MPAALRIPSSEPAIASTAAAELLAIADAMAASGFAAHSPVWDGSAYLAITNARDALCDLTITASGTVTWDYRSRHGSHANPGHITGIVLDLLAPGSNHHLAPAPAPRPGSTLKSTTGRALASHGMRVILHLLDQDSDYYETYAEIQVTNPATPARGTVHLTDDGDLHWHCRTRHPAGGITPAEIAATITRALTRAQHAPCHA
jgi:hypothetical protein